MAEPSGGTLSPRALNRALLARQGLLAKEPAGAAAMVERLVGLQAQVPGNPYVALFARLPAFDPAELSELLASRQVVRAQLMRSTIHLVTAEDWRTLRPLTAERLRKSFLSSFQRRSVGLDGDAVAAAGAALLDDAPLGRVEVGRALAAQFAAYEPEILGLAFTFHAALVQTPPRGLWKRSGAARWALGEAYLGAPVRADATLEEVVLRYLAAFGPATAADIRTWSGFTGLADVLARLRPGLRTFTDEAGRELLDVPDGPLPDPATPAPPRFLPEYDNLQLAHADRARLLADAGPGRPIGLGPWFGTLLVDGAHRANWKADVGKTEATLTVDCFTPARTDPADTRAAILEEAEGLLAMLAPDAAARHVRFVR